MYVILESNPTGGVPRVLDDGWIWTDLREAQQARRLAERTNRQYRYSIHKIGQPIIEGQP